MYILIVIEYINSSKSKEDFISDCPIVRVKCLQSEKVLNIKSILILSSKLGSHNHLK